MKFALSSVLAIALGAVSLSGCATHALLEKDSGGMVTKQTKKVLVNDHVVAFGKPSIHLPNIPNDAVVIIGQKHSYILTEGGSAFTTLINRLDPRYLKLNEPLDFYSANNDGGFTGKLSLRYTRLKAEISNNDLNFFLQNNVTECSSHADQQLQAQSYCFTIPLKGLSYPAVSNQASLKALSRPYPVSIYTTEEVTSYREGNSNPVEKLVLFPFAVAFDVVTLPLQALGKIFD